jgi:hypothetical protein
MGGWHDAKLPPCHRWRAGPPLGMHCRHGHGEFANNRHSRAHARRQGLHKFPIVPQRPDSAGLKPGEHGVPRAMVSHDRARIVQLVARANEKRVGAYGTQMCEIRFLALTPIGLGHIRPSRWC